MQRTCTYFFFIYNNIPRTNNVIQYQNKDINSVCQEVRMTDNELTLKCIYTSFHTTKSTHVKSSFLTKWRFKIPTQSQYTDKAAVYSGVFSLMCTVFCRSLFVLLFFFWALCCLLFLDLWITITTLVTSSSSWNEI